MLSRTGFCARCVYCPINAIVAYSAIFLLLNSPSFSQARVSQCWRPPRPFQVGLGQCWRLRFRPWVRFLHNTLSKYMGAHISKSECFDGVWPVEIVPPAPTPVHSIQFLSSPFLLVFVLTFHVVFVLVFVFVLFFVFSLVLVFVFVIVCVFVFALIFVSVSHLVRARLSLVCLRLSLASPNRQAFLTLSSIRLPPPSRPVFLVLSSVVFVCPVRPVTQVHFCRLRALWLLSLVGVVVFVASVA